MYSSVLSRGRGRILQRNTSILGRRMVSWRSICEHVRSRETGACGSSPTGNLFPSTSCNENVDGKIACTAPGARSLYGLGGIDNFVMMVLDTDIIDRMSVTGNIQSTYIEASLLDVFI